MENISDFKNYGFLYYLSLKSHFITVFVKKSFIRTLF